MSTQSKSTCTSYTALNFTDAHVLEVSVNRPRETSFCAHIPALVSLYRSSESLAFQFAMTAKQARNMAIELHRMADLADQFDAEHEMEAAIDAENEIEAAAAAEMEWVEA